MAKEVVYSHPPTSLVEAREDERAASYNDDDDDDNLDADDLRQLNEAIAESEAQFARGEGIPAEAALAKMRRILHGT
ncbi:MAG: hypothetical protein HUU21_24650 [Polyangiaceae bacterium]|nr:hypothetical protein [Polyangiaceae bacterium]